MAFPSKSGKKFPSAFMAKSHDERHQGGDSAQEPKNNPFAKSGPSAGAKPAFGGAAHEAAESPEFEQGEQEGQNEQPAQVVAQHGPAHTIHIASDHKAGKHKVISSHADGHVHESDHATAGEAHDAAKQLSGPGQENPEQAQGAAPQAPESDGFQMPSLGA